MTIGYAVECPICLTHDYRPKVAARVPFPILVTGSVETPPEHPDGLAYNSCDGCGRYVRYEFVPQVTSHSRQLTRAEQEVVECIAKGWSTSHIGDYLGIEEETVRWHVSNISEKLPPYGDLIGYKLVLWWVSHRVLREAA